MNEKEAGPAPREAGKPRKYGGAPTKKGLELFAKLAVTRNQLCICDVLVGSGTVPDDVYIGDLEALIEPVGVGTCSEPVRDGAAVLLTVECRSDLNKELPDGMTIREFMIRAYDPEEDGPVAIYYGCLADYPQYVAPWEEGYLDVRRYPVTIRLAPSVDVTLDDELPRVVMTLDDIQSYCTTTVLPQLLAASQNQVSAHNQSTEAHPDLRRSIAEVKQAVRDVTASSEDLSTKKQDAITAIGLLKRDAQGNIVSAEAGVDYGLPAPAAAPGKPLEELAGKPGQHYFDSQTGQEYICKGQDKNGNYIWEETSGIKSFHMAFEAKDWTNGVLRIPQTVHGIKPRQSACVGALRQRVNGTMVSNTWAVIESRMYWDLTTNTLVLESAAPFAGDLTVVG